MKLFDTTDSSKRICEWFKHLESFLKLYQHLSPEISPFKSQHHQSLIILLIFSDMWYKKNYWNCYEDIHECKLFPIDKS